MGKAAPLAARRQHRCRAFTLAESLMASVVLAIAVVAVATTLMASHYQTRVMQTGSSGVAMARQLMEEIAAKPLVSSDPTPGWSAGVQDRSQYDTVNDYDGYTDTTPLPTLEGAALDVASVPFTRTVALHYPTLLFGTAPAFGDFAVVEVHARDAAGNGCTLRRLVACTNLQR